jgi:hypothetical protein
MVVCRAGVRHGSPHERACECTHLAGRVKAEHEDPRVLVLAPAHERAERREQVRYRQAHGGGGEGCACRRGRRSAESGKARKAAAPGCRARATRSLAFYFRSLRRRANLRFDYTGYCLLLPIMSPTEAVDAFPAVKEKKSKKKKAAAAATTTAEPSEHPEPPQDLAHDDPEADAAAAEAPKTQKKAKRAAVDGDRSADGDSDAARRAAKAAKKKAREEAVARNLPAIAAAVSALDAAAAANMAVVTAALAEGGALDRLSLATAVSATKDKNRSRKTADSEASAQPDAPEPSVGDLPAAQNTTNGEAAVPRKHKSKKQDGVALSVDIDTAVEGEPSATGERKKKKKKREPEDAQPAGRAEPSKKRKKDKYPDPAEDTELSDHAQKGRPRSLPLFMGTHTHQQPSLMPMHLLSILRLGSSTRQLRTGFCAIYGPMQRYIFLCGHGAACTQM